VAVRPVLKTKSSAVFFLTTLAYCRKEPTPYVHSRQGRFTYS